MMRKNNEDDVFLWEDNITFLSEIFQILQKSPKVIFNVYNGTLKLINAFGSSRTLDVLMNLPWNIDELMIYWWTGHVLMGMNQCIDPWSDEVLMNIDEVINR